MPIISVVIPAYQCQGVIGRALTSVLEQDFQDFEIIVVDDGSKDGTADVTKAFVAQDNRIRYYHQHNQGPAVARNRGVALAQGEYIAFLDSDDEWLPHKLGLQVAVLNAYPEVGIVITDSMHEDLVNHQSRPYSELHRLGLGRLNKRQVADPPNTFIMEDSRLRAVLFNANFVNTSTVVIRRAVFDTIRGFDPICIGTEDVDLYIRLANIVQFAYVERIAARRYKDSTALTWRNERYMRELVRLYQSYKQSAEFSDLHGFVDEQLLFTYKQLVKLYGRSWSPAKAFAVFQESLSVGFNPQLALYTVGSILGPTPFYLGGQASRIMTSLRRGRH